MHIDNFTPQRVSPVYIYLSCCCSHSHSYELYRYIFCNFKFYFKHGKDHKHDDNLTPQRPSWVSDGLVITCIEKDSGSDSKFKSSST